MVCHDPAGEVLVATGGSFYPNLDRAEAYAIVNHGGRHTTVRGFRRLGVDRADLRVGPINPRIVRGMRWWRYELEPNEWGISYQLDFRDTTRQVFREPQSDSAGGSSAGTTQRRHHRIRELRRGRGMGRGRRDAGSRSRRDRRGPAIATGASGAESADRPCPSAVVCTSACRATPSSRSRAGRCGATGSSTATATNAPACCGWAGRSGGSASSPTRTSSSRGSSTTRSTTGR